MLGGITMDAANEGESPVLGDLWRLDLRTATWENLGSQIPAPVPPPAYFQSMVCTDDGCLVVFGGVLDARSVQRSDLIHILRVGSCRVPSLTYLCCEKLAQDASRDHISDMDWEMTLPKVGAAAFHHFFYIPSLVV